MSTCCSTCGQALPRAAGPRWEFSLPLEPLSQNDPASANRGPARFEYARRRLGYQLLLVSQRNLLGIPVARGRRRVVITRLYSKHGRERDRGNLIGGCKMLLDAMTRAGLIVDDREQYVEDHYHQRRAPAPGTLVLIEELEAKEVIRGAR